MNVAVINSGDTLSLTFLQEGGQTVLFNLKHPNISVVTQKLKDNSLTYDEAVKLQKKENGLAVKVANYTVGACTIKDGKVFYKDKEVHSVLAGKIVEFMVKKLPFDHLLRFMERLYANPSAWAVESLFLFLEKKGFPITEDGCFIGYKAVRGDYLDYWSGTKDFTPGKSAEVLERLERNQVDDNRNKECSFGYHVGTLHYAKRYCRRGGKIILVKVAPEDVVSVPSEGQAEKIRCVWCESLKDYYQQNVIEHALVDECCQGLDEDYEEDYDDEDEEDYLEDFFNDEDEDKYDTFNEGEYDDEDDTSEEPATQSPPKLKWWVRFFQEG